MNKPSLQQISDFGLALVEKEKLTISKNKEYFSIRKSKRYSRYIVIYVASIFYDYSREEISDFFNISLNVVSQYLNKVRNSVSKQDLAEELHDSLEILYGNKKKITKDAYISKILPIFANENNSGVRSINDLSKLEIWLINRLYETAYK